MASIYKYGRRWRAQVRIKNRPTVSEIFDSKAEAVIWARTVETDMHKSSGSNPMITFGEILDVYEANSRPGGRSKQSVLRTLRAEWGDWRIREIHSGTITAFVNKRERGGAAPATIYQDLVYLKTALKHGGVLAGSDEAVLAKEKVASAIMTLRHLGKVADSEERTRRPTEEELGRLIDFFAARPRSNVPMGDIVLWAICTCCRLSEITGAKGVRIEDIDPRERTAWIRARKDPTKPGGRDDLIPLVLGPVTFRGNVVDPVEIALRHSVHRTEGPVWRHAKNTVDIAWIDACKKLGIEDLRFHDLRHDGVSRLFEAGYDIPQVAAISGHRSWKNLRRYTNLRPGAVQRENLLPGMQP
jgi:integrase